MVELGDRFKDTPADAAAVAPRPAAEAVQALTRLGYAPAQAETAVSAVLAEGTVETARLIRDALKRLAVK